MSLGGHLHSFSSQDEAAKEMHQENKVMKKQLIGLLAKVLILMLKLYLHPVILLVSSFKVTFCYFCVCCQMVGATREEVEEMGNA